MNTINEPKPFIKWAGGKTAILNTLLKYIPQKIENYCEPFLGGGALFFKIHDRIKNAYLSDINSDLITTYNVIKNDVEKLIVKLSIHKKNDSKDYYYKIRSTKYNDEVSIAARFIYLNKTCYNGLYRVNSKNEFNVPYGKYKNPKVCDKKNLLLCNKLFQKVLFKNCSYEEIFVRQNNFIYCDPPYHNTFNQYDKHKFNETDQKFLSEWINLCYNNDNKVMLSNSNTNLIKNLYMNFDVIEIETPRKINRSFTKELLIKSKNF